MSTENSLIDADIWISCDDGIHLILMDESNDHFGWVFRQVVGGWPYSVRKATDHEMAHARARQHLRTGVKQIEAEYHPAPQPHPEPIAWMVGTAIWWTKEEAERDAAETGLPIVGLGPMSGAAPVAQNQGEPLPITNDMHRLMEACRIGEFKDEGGSETVEALAVASLDAKSAMGHDEDSYMMGYRAALYEQAEPFIWMSLRSQRQGDPSEVERLRENHRKHAARLINERGRLRAQLAEAHALLRRAYRLAPPELGREINAALSASAEQEARS